MSSLTPMVIGGGLAGCEAARVLARAGIPVDLCEMRPDKQTPAHRTGMLAELVCSNSFRSVNPENAIGLLKREMLALGSIVMETALENRVRAGDALAVDRVLFSEGITAKIQSVRRIRLQRVEVMELPQDRPVIIASGPLTSAPLSERISDLTGEGHLYFYDAIAPVISADSLDQTMTFSQSRYGKGEGDDYINCPIDEETYHGFVKALVEAEKVPCREFEKEIHFSGCMPMEAIAGSGPMALAHGPLKPVGLIDPGTGQRPFAVLQLRMENASGTAWNLVGCQTKLTYGEQKRIFRMIPGLQQVEFLRFGSMHRNTFIDGPALLDGSLRLVRSPKILFAGQITGVEGYLESAACGMLAGMFLSGELLGLEIQPPPPETALGSLLLHVTSSSLKHFQPSNVNYGLFPPLQGRVPKALRNAAYAERACIVFEAWVRHPGMSFLRESFPG